MIVERRGDSGRRHIRLLCRRYETPSRHNRIRTRPANRARRWQPRLSIAIPGAGPHHEPDPALASAPTARPGPCHIPNPTAAAPDGLATGRDASQRSAHTVRVRLRPAGGRKRRDPPRPQARYRDRVARRNRQAPQGHRLGRHSCYRSRPAREYGSSTRLPASVGPVQPAGPRLPARAEPPPARLPSQPQDRKTPAPAQRPNHEQVDNRHR